MASGRFAVCIRFALDLRREMQTPLLTAELACCSKILQEGDARPAPRHRPRVAPGVLEGRVDRCSFSYGTRGVGDDGQHRNGENPARSRAQGGCARRSWPPATTGSPVRARLLQSDSGSRQDVELGATLSTRVAGSPVESDRSRSTVGHSVARRCQLYFEPRTPLGRGVGNADIRSGPGSQSN